MQINMLAIMYTRYLEAQCRTRFVCALVFHVPFCYFSADIKVVVIIVTILQPDFYNYIEDMAATVY